MYSTRAIRNHLEALMKKKQAELDTRSKREQHLRTLSDRNYKFNSEQWEAFELGIQHQQDKILLLICDLMTIKKVLAGIG